MIIHWFDRGLATTTSCYKVVRPVNHSVCLILHDSNDNCDTSQQGHVKSSGYLWPDSKKSESKTHHH